MLYGRQAELAKCKAEADGLRVRAMRFLRWQGFELLRPS